MWSHAPWVRREAELGDSSAMPSEGRLKVGWLGLGYDSLINSTLHEFNR